VSSKVRLLIVDDEKLFRELLEDRFAQNDFEVTACASSEDALEKVAEQEFDIGILDMRMPGITGIELFKKIKASHTFFEAVILTGVATVDSAIEAMKHGVYDYLTKPCKLSELEMIVRKADEKRRLALENARLKSSIASHNINYDLSGNSSYLKNLKKLAKRVASSQAPILIKGESGTGKEFLARHIHSIANGDSAPFITVDCSVHAHGILENFLFGYEQNAFAGATTAHTGWLQLADGGTILLKDIETLHLSTQVKIHDFLEAGTFHKVGSNIDCRFNARIIATTGKDLYEMVLKRLFREDLFYKLGVITLETIPLKERKEDIPDLIKSIVAEKGSATNGKKFSNKAVNAMLKYNWPGNIRELRNIIERATILSSKKTILGGDIPIPSNSKSKKEKEKHLLSLLEVEKEHILHVLNATDGNISLASRVLGISRPKLYRKIARYKTGKI